ncbi:MAG: class I SAM-dependent methyltransferase [Cyanobacteria bacterium J06626_18]
MATFLRNLSYRYQWLFDLIVGISSLSVGGEAQFRQLPLKGVVIRPETKVLDLCCGSGQATEFLVKYSKHVVGLDADPLPLKRAKQQIPEASYVQAWAEAMPFVDDEFDVIHTSATLLNLYLFLWLFENETAWSLVQLDLPELLTAMGFEVTKFKVHAGGSLQVMHGRKVG